MPGRAASRCLFLSRLTSHVSPASIPPMNPAPNLFFVGPMGAGKTTIGRRVADLLALPFFDLDHEIETHTGATIPLIFDVEGESGFRQREQTVLAEFAAKS